MKLLASADIHNNREIIEKIIYLFNKEKPDFVVLVGDIAEVGRLDIKLFKLLLSYVDPKKIIVIPGNNDLPTKFYELSKKYGFILLDKNYLVKDDTILVGIGGGDVPLYIVEEDEIKYVLDKIKKFKDKKIVILSHIPPKDSKTSLGISGSSYLTKFIINYSPKIVIHGHIHEGGGLEDIIKNTKIINVAGDVRIIII